MKNILKIFIDDVKRIRKNVIAMIVVIGVLVVPCLYAWFNIAASWDPYNNTGNLKVTLLIVVFISVNVFLEFSKTCFPSADSVFSSFKKSEDAVSRDWAEDVIPEKVSCVDAIISMSSDASPRLWIRLSTSRSAPFASAILETD